MTFTGKSASETLSLKHFRGRIDEKSNDRNVAPVLIVALGDSVTQGVGQVDEFFREEVYHRRLVAMLEDRHPLTTISSINAGVDGHTVPKGLARLERDVLRHQPDLVIVGFALNDAALFQMAGLKEYIAGLEQIIGEIRTKTPSDIILMTPNMMLTRDNERVADRYKQYVEMLIETQVGGTLPAYIEGMRDVGEKLNVPVADVYAEWERMARSGQDTTAMLSNGLNHPDAERHQLAADVLMRVIESAGK